MAVPPLSFAPELLTTFSESRLSIGGPEGRSELGGYARIGGPDRPVRATFTVSYARTPLVITMQDVTLGGCVAVATGPGRHGREQRFASW